MPVELNPGQIDRLRAELRAGRKLVAVKLYKQWSGSSLLAAKQFVERLDDGNHDGAGVGRHPDDEQIDAVLEALEHGRKLEAVRLYRQSSGAGLKESKQFVERLMRELGIHDPGWMPAGCTTVGLATLTIVVWCTALAASSRGREPRDDEVVTKITVTVDRGADLGQAFGSLFEATTSDGLLVIGAGFQNGYNTRYRADRHALQFYIRPTVGDRQLTVEPLPRPNQLCGTYLYARDEVVHSTYGGHRRWDAAQSEWVDQASSGGTEETMRVGDGVLRYGDSTVRYQDHTILRPPRKGSYQLFFYARGYLCFYHVHRGDGPYRPYVDDQDGFSKLLACPWTPKESEVDLSKAIVMTLPVVGETTFAWGQWQDQIVTGSNIGGFYRFADNRWQMLLDPDLNSSYQLYSTMSFHDRLLMGQYPTGRIFQYDGRQISDHPGWPPQLDGVSGSAREAQTTAIYGGDLFVGVWPWAELWRYNRDQDDWSFVNRMFDHPAPSDQVVHPYDVENQANETGNLWGQRVTSLVTSGGDLFVSTSAKHPCQWNPTKYPFLAPDKWKSYGAVYRLSMPGHLGAAARWTEGPTTFVFTVTPAEMTMEQDGRRVRSVPLGGLPRQRAASLRSLRPIEWGSGIYGQFAGSAIAGTIDDPRSDGRARSR